MTNAQQVKMADIYKLVVEQCQEGILIVQQGLVQFANPYLSDLSGYSNREFKEHGIENFVHPEDKECVLRRHFDRLSGKEVPQRYEFRAIKKNGQVIYISISGILIEWEGAPASLNFIHDITSEVKARKAAQIAHDRIRAMFDNVPIGMFESSPDGKFYYVNNAIVKMLGYNSPHELIEYVNKTSIAEALYENAQMRPEFIRKVKDGSYNWKSFNNRYKCKSGKAIDAILTFSTYSDPFSGKDRLCGFVQDVTDQIATLNKLREAERRFYSLFQSAPTMISFGDFKTGKFIDINKKFEEISGYSRQEIIGKTSIELGWLTPERRSILVNELNKKKTISKFVTIKNKQGKEIEVIYNAARVVIGNNEYMLSNLEDISELKEIESKLIASTEQYKLLFDSANDPIFVHPYNDKKMSKFTEVNAVACSKLGYTREELLKMTPPELNPKDDYEANSKAWSILKHEGNVIFETHHIPKSGEIIPVEVSCRLFKRGGETNVLSIARDCTERKQAEKALLKAKDLAEQANKTKSEFLANMSHELRTPLNGIVGMMQLLETTELNEEQQEYANAAVKSSDRLTQLLSDILDISRIEAGRMLLVNKPFDLSETVEEVCQLFTLAAEQKELDFSYHIDPATPHFFVGDRLRIQQVLNNLVGNAIKYTNSGSVTLTIHFQCINNARSRMLFFVSDTGPGIPDEKIDELFLPFTQASAGFTRQYEGAGLGLAICKRLVDLMKGNLTVDSNLNEGTTMILSLPLEEDIQTTSVEGTHKVKNSGSVKLKVLVVEDDYINNYAVRILLEKEGFEVMCAATGKEALEVLEKHRIDVVLMDIQMPDMNGIEATEAIRKGEAGDEHIRIPIVAMTAYSMNGDREIFLNAGMNSYVSKPVSKPQLLDAIAEAITNPVII
ncbi:PAS domain S-box protein [Maridesulfovibrio sp.]|uniref:PAS domain S-box protein n=1 Tax=unclassified Maridesulfovibrio TaxID=2794999 RepID=UPI003B008701